MGEYTSLSCSINNNVDEDNHDGDHDHRCGRHQYYCHRIYSRRNVKRITITSTTTMTTDGVVNIVLMAVDEAIINTTLTAGSLCRAYSQRVQIPCV